MAELGLHDLRPNPGSTKNTKRLGRGKGSGQGKTAGKGHKGYNSRSGGGVRPGYEGGQTPLYMRLGKLRGPHMKKSMPIGPFRTYAVPVNVGRLALAFAAGDEVTPEALVAKGIVKNTRTPIKILGGGDLDKALNVRMAMYSRSAVTRSRQSAAKPSSSDRRGGVAAVNNKLWQSLVNAWKIPDLRTKVLFTAAMIAIYRFGAHVPTPGVNLDALQKFFDEGGAGVVGFLDLFSGGALARVALFALGIMPYITASIIMQLLTVVIPSSRRSPKKASRARRRSPSTRAGSPWACRSCRRWATWCCSAARTRCPTSTGGAAP